MLPYWLITENFGAMSFDARGLILILVTGVVNTAVAYVLYFSAIEYVSAQSASILSYIDPAVAVILSALVLGERLTLVTGVGIVLVLGAAMASEIHRKTGDY